MICTDKFPIREKEKPTLRPHVCVSPSLLTTDGIVRFEVVGASLVQV